MIKSINLIILLVFVLCLKASSKDIYLSDYGVNPWSFENASPKIVEAIEESKGEKEVVINFPEGRIDLWPEGAVKKELYISNSTEQDSISKIRNIGLCLEDLHGITLKGNNTLIVLHGKMISFLIKNSTDIRIEGISFDYERPTMSELTVLKASDDKVKLRVHPDSKYIIKDGKVTFYGEGWKSKHHHNNLVRPDENTMSYSSWNPFKDGIAKHAGLNEIDYEGDFRKLDLKVGDVFTMRDTYRDNCGGFINRSKNIELNNVNMHFMHGMGIISQFTENIKFNKVSVVPRKKSGRMVAAFADCFHFSGCKGLIELDGCRTSGSHDDPMNVHGTHLEISKIVNGNQITVDFKHNQTFGFNAFNVGDSVSFVKSECLLEYGNAVVKKAKLVSLTKMVLELDRDLPKEIGVGDCLENITWTPEVIVRNCHFERVSTRGILVTTRRKVLIENNTFLRTGMHGILIANDCNSWYESGPVRDVTIQGNKFIQCAYNQGNDGYVIAIKPEVETFKKGKYVHSNIRILDNDFSCNSEKILIARSVDNLIIRNNRINYLPIENSNLTPSQPEFKMKNCKDVKIENNTFIGFQNNNLKIE